MYSSNSTKRGTHAIIVNGSYPAAQYERGSGVLKVDSFINHKMRSALILDSCGQEFARLFSGVGATRVLTAEISGIAPALMTARHLGLPVVYARKNKPITMPDEVYLTLAPSHAKGHLGGAHRQPRVPGRR